jgi:hypothetical protein
VGLGSQKMAAKGFSTTMGDVSRMWRIAQGIILAVACSLGQPIQSLLLPQARHIVGTVVDAQGAKVAEARIEHSNDHRQEHLTNAAGRFELETRAPIVVIRKAGFRSELVRTKDATEVQVTLRKLSDSRPFPICSQAGPYEGIEGWGASLVLQDA